MVTVMNNSHPLPSGFRSPFSWAPILYGAMDRVMYPAIGRRENIRPQTTLLREYSVTSREPTDPLRYVSDKYTRIGKHYLCCRSYNGPIRHEECIIDMCLTEDQKESIAAAAMHPSRLEKWLAKGWEEEWDNYF